MTTPDVAIQIVNYKTKKFLNPLLESITKDIADSKLSIEINILDNASGDNLEDIGAKWRGYNVRIYNSDKNGGFGAGHNQLAGKTNARYILILNPDLLFIESKTIDRLVQTSKQHRATVVGPRLLTPRSRNDEAIHKLSNQQLKQQPWDHFKHGLSIGPYRTHDKLIEAAWVSGAVFLIERQKFIDIGTFDEKFFLYYEEVDLCRRLRKQGGKVIYDPSIQVLHYGCAVASHFSRHMAKSFLYFHLKLLKPPKS